MPIPREGLPIKKTRERLQRFIDEFDTNPPTRLQMLRIMMVLFRWIMRFESNFKYFNDDDAETPGGTG